MPHVDVLVFGDEIESVLAAVSAAQTGASVALCRKSVDFSQCVNPAHPWLGGLSTRGGLAYMDLTWGMFSPLFQRFIAQCGVKRVCLNPQTAHSVLSQWLQQQHIPVIHCHSVYTGLHVQPDNPKRFTVQGHDGQSWTAPLAIDATPDADIARALGEPWLNGMHGLLDKLDGQTASPQHIGVSPVFRIEGVTCQNLIAFEGQCREQTTMADLTVALPWHSDAERGELLTRLCFSPNGLDYIDILNPIMGVAFHRWWQGAVDTYPHARVWIDGGNVACLPDGSLSFNGMITPAASLPTLLHWSTYPVIPAFLQDAMAAFERFLQQAGGFKQARVIPPAQLYVRQTVHVLTRQMASAASLLQGGLPDATLGPYSYWLDTRGVNLRPYCPGFTHFKNPCFNTHLDYTLCRYNPHLAVVGRSAGYGPLAQGTGRIVQHNAMLAEALGHFAATRQGQPFWTGPPPPHHKADTLGNPLLSREQAIITQALTHNE